MIRSNIILIWLSPLWLVLVYSCYTWGTKPSLCGIVQLKVRQYDSLSKKYTLSKGLPDLKIWYKDSMAIEEIRRVEFETDTNGYTKVRMPLAYYLFMDVKNKMYFKYFLS